MTKWKCGFELGSVRFAREQQQQLEHRRGIMTECEADPFDGCTHVLLYLPLG